MGNLQKWVKKQEQKQRGDILAGFAKKSKGNSGEAIAVDTPGASVELLAFLRDVVFAQTGDIGIVSVVDPANKFLRVAKITSAKCAEQLTGLTFMKAFSIGRRVLDSARMGICSAMQWIWRGMIRRFRLSRSSRMAQLLLLHTVSKTIPSLSRLWCVGRTRK